MKKFISIFIIIFCFFLSCESTIQEMYLEGFREAGFSDDFVEKKRQEIEQTEIEYEKEYAKQEEAKYEEEYENLYGKPKKTKYVKEYEMGVVINYINSDLFIGKMRDNLNLSIKTNINNQTKLNVYFEDKKHQKYIIDLLVSNKSKNTNIDEITLIFHKHGKYLREYSIKSIYKMNDEDKEIPFKNMCDIVSGYIIMVLKNDLKNNG